MNGKKRTRAGSGLPVPLPFVLVFVLAVLLPSIALSLLALRAADREAVYVERSLEAALLAEVNLAAQKISALLESLAGDLKRQAERISGPEALEGWGTSPSPAAFPFFVTGGRLFVPDGYHPRLDAFLQSFGPFLEDREEMQVYDSIAGVYRKEMGEAPPALSYAPLSQPAAEEASPREDTGEGLHAELPAGTAGRVARPLKAPPVTAAAPLPAPAKKAAAPQGGIERQMAQSMAAADPAFREELFRKAEEEGFSLLQRNVAPQAGAAPSPEREERSGTVARGKSFAALRSESEGGFLPRLSERGLELIFWTDVPGGAAGFSIDMDDLRDRIAGAAPEALTDIRVLTVLDDRGNPLVSPPLPSGADWRRPFVAREISPLLPRWEAGAWLTNPGLAASRARFATIAVWLLTGILFVVILAGAGVIMRMLSAEMRLAANKTTFVANVSHELKTPLTSIRLFAEMLLSGRQQSEERRKEYLRTMVSETERLSRLVDNVLAFSRKGADIRPLPMERLDLAALAEDTLAQLEPHLAKNGFVSGFSAEGPLPVLGNSEALRQVLMNLLSNSEKYSPAVREVTVCCGREGETAAVRVADRGSGVPPGLGEKIFQEFFRGDDSLAAPRSGAGLGLAIARDIARRHGGDVKYDPREGGGSVFSLVLPLAFPEGKERRG
ncbi:MAG TPA: HAMP domain-containing sensor histidine kinase [Aminivibrio sp.]|uniref:sensor histidine kinase n=1 Tax=Aminivibrio sp. TaxID=1872489 RepID=UPI002CED5419|nr:HAMP domain-containing sensor histidine kinase [Aminivibrio sp.]HPF85745.1 HAMP domain-containing sensor histidine kinase [Aminivibrio sp.]